MYSQCGKKNNLKHHNYLQKYFSFGYKNLTQTNFYYRIIWNMFMFLPIKGNCKWFVIEASGV